MATAYSEDTKLGSADLMASVSKDLKSYKIRKFEEKNEIATVTVEAWYKKDSKRVIVIDLEKTDEGWKIIKS
ncbi:hypothetical protein COL21_13370 [Bacillus thuringiensis]|uniref:DUF4878 domain-containing protein n=1 Tax=Bacillus thuringiensis TaxID=1428 RepID=UPI000BF9409B|nr:hypothetical protein COL21_13370 [Bacillus thuringiensis]PGR99448.1 hypothetical protein COC68_08155 [Bacillus thuringiensis]